LQKLPIADRLSVIEAALQTLREVLERHDRPLQVTNQQALALAAQSLFDDYANDDELTGFTALDGDDVHA
jgi:hypothetical protein